MKGILFTEPMFHKVVAGTKTQTRRLGGLNYINDQEDVSLIGWETDPEVVPAADESKTINWKGIYPCFKTPNGHFEECYVRPRYQPGEIVYLKEPYIIDTEIYDVIPGKPRSIYKFDHPEVTLLKWNNKLFMPAKYARYFIKIKDVRVERITQITREDSIAEGFEDRVQFFAAFKKINKLSSDDGYPWVFAYTFELTERLSL